MIDRVSVCAPTDTTVPTARTANHLLTLSDATSDDVFATTAPATIVVRGTTDEMAAAATWMTSHNALFE